MSDRVQYDGIPKISTCAGATVVSFADFEAEFVHGVDQHAEMFGVDSLVNTVAEVEDMARVIAEASDDIPGASPDFVGLRIQYAGIEITL